VPWRPDRSAGVVPDALVRLALPDKSYRIIFIIYYVGLYISAVYERASPIWHSLMHWDEHTGGQEQWPGHRSRPTLAEA
jgi:hypothetical protein